MDRGTIFDIQHFCTGDGPGIRTTVFLKGCTLHCAWCHNPESQDPRPEILMNIGNCIGCGSCDAACPGSDARRILSSRESRLSECPPGCLACSEACPSSCLETAGRSVTVREVMQEVMQDEAYYRHSGGGITLSGGEPMAQPSFSTALLEAACSRGIDTAVETSGNGKADDFISATRWTGLWLWDIKLMDPILYKEYTGGSLETMLSSLEAVAGTGARLCLRILYIPEIHDDERVVSSTRRLLEMYPDADKEIIPYHLLGNAKRVKLGLPEKRFREPDKDMVKAFARTIGLA